MNRILVNPERVLGRIDPNIFGGFAEHLERCVYGGMYEPGSPLTDERGFRKDVLEAIQQLKMPIIRYPGGNFVSGYRWIDGVGPRQDRPVRMDMAWHTFDTNHFGTNEFIDYCRELSTEPYLVVNCGDGDMREARDWVEYCNGTHDTALVRLRRQHGYDQPHEVKYWGIGNEVDGPWQIGYKTPQEYARAVTEYGKVMKWVDPSIKLIANGVSNWEANDFVERAHLLLEQAGNLIDYLAVHWYVDNETGDFAHYMALSELFEQRLSAYEGLIKAIKLEQKIDRPIYIAVDEWNVWHRSEMATGGHNAVIYDLADALVVAMQLNAFIRHSNIVKMANIAQIVKVLAPIFTASDGMVLQTIFYPFALYSDLAGSIAIDTAYTGETFSAGGDSDMPILDTVATYNTDAKQLTVFVINRSENVTLETTLTLAQGRFVGPVEAHTVNGPAIGARNVFDTPNQVGTTVSQLVGQDREIVVEFAPHSITALVCPID